MAWWRLDRYCQPAAPQARCGFSYSHQPAPTLVHCRPAGRVLIRWPQSQTRAVSSGCYSWTRTTTMRWTSTKQSSCRQALTRTWQAVAKALHQVALLLWHMNPGSKCLQQQLWLAGCACSGDGAAHHQPSRQPLQQTIPQSNGRLSSLSR